MARDLATLGQAIEQLKASQARMARDNANAAEQLKASQEQMARVIAKASEAKAFEARAYEQRPKISAPPPRPTATPTRKPVPTPLTIPGVGHLTALAFTAAVDHPERFVWSALTVARFTMI